jgi:hypothetical protein
VHCEHGSKRTCGSREGGKAVNGQLAVSDEVIGLDGVSAPWLADQLDRHGVVCLRDVFSAEWLEALRVLVTDNITNHGDGDFLIPQADHDIGSPAHRLVSDSALRKLFSETARLRFPKVDAAQDIQCGITVRAGTGPKVRSNLFHYDASVLTMVVPIFLPRAAVGTCGELAAFGNKRPFRRFVASHLLDMVMTYRAAYRRRITKAVLDAPEKYIVDFQPGDACMFWGYRTYHGNLACAPGLLRATLVLQYGEVHAGSRAMGLVWRLGRSRRALRRFQCRTATSADSADGAAVQNR